VVDKGPDWFAVEVSAETLSRTAGDWSEGTPLNLERALRVGDELGGHIVTGHVDGVGTVAEVIPEGDSTRIVVEAPAALAPYIAAKGSITLDGVSLTVNEVTDLAGGGVRFGINIIPHTQEMTTFGDLAPGRALNIEIDVLARYLGRMEQLRPRVAHAG
jgi:riboflavin synthase